MRSLLAVLLLASPAAAADRKFEDLAELSVRIEPAQARPGQEVTLILTVTPKPNCWTYPTNVTQLSRNRIKLPTDAEVVFLPAVVDPTGAKTKLNKEGAVEQYYPTTVEWKLPAVVRPTAAAGKRTLTLAGRIQACDDRNCLPIDPMPSAVVEVLPGPPVPVRPEFLPVLIPPAYAALLGPAYATLLDPVYAAVQGPVPAGPGSRLPVRTIGPPPTAKPTDAAPVGLIRKDAVSPAAHVAALDKLRANLVNDTNTLPSNSLWAFLVTAAVWGFVSLATPCVFPMIPITVSLFLKQGHKETGQVLRLAAVYCLTIVVVLGLAAVFLLGVFRVLSVNPYMNLFLGGLFVFFTVSLLGMFEATPRAVTLGVCGLALLLLGFSVLWKQPLFDVPPDLFPASYTQRLLATAVVAVVPAGIIGYLLFGKGATDEGVVLKFAERRRAVGGLVGTVFGAVAFSIVSFTCVAPFLGGFAGMAASGQFSFPQLLAGGLTFAAAFASPFFLLALFPSLLKKLPRSGGWLGTVKVVMGFLELAAAFKFFRTAELRLLPRAEYFTYDVALAGTIVVAVAAGLYLLGLFRLPHDDEPTHQLGVPRLLFALAFLGLGLHLLPGLFGQRPRGVPFAWVDSFLLPDPGEGKELPWNSDLTDALKRARENNRLVFVDFTGKTCTNCRLNEHDVFTLKPVEELLLKYELAAMYTDTVPAEFYRVVPPTDDTDAEGAANLRFQNAVFRTTQLPLYVILEPLAGGKARVVAVYDEGKINDRGAFLAFLKAPLEPPADKK